MLSTFASGIPLPLLLVDALEAVEGCRLSPAGEADNCGVIGASNANEDDIDDIRERVAISGEERIGGVTPVMQSTTKNRGGFLGEVDSFATGVALDTRSSSLKISSRLEMRRSNNSRI